MIKRELYLSKIRPFYDNDLIKILIGVRRCGKSVIMKQIIDELLNSGVSEENIIYINFELFEYNKLKENDKFYKYIKSRITNKDKYYLLFDEIQNVNEFELVINSFRVELNCSIFLTGSNSKLLSSELSTHLSGRYVSFKIMPFTYKETCELLKQRNVEITKNTFEEFLKWGGMPQRFNFENETEIRTYLIDVYDSIILRDIVERANIKNVYLLNIIMQFLIENIGQIFSANSITKFLKQEKVNVGTETLYNYVEHIKSSLIFNKVDRYDIRGKRVLATFDKYYVADLGIRQIKKSNIEFNLGGSLENVIYNELIARGYEVNIGKLNDGEIDFIATKDGIKEYYQVAYLISDDNVMKREFDILNKVEDNYAKYVISLDEIDMSQNGIIHKNAIDFLLEETK